MSVGKWVFTVNFNLIIAVCNIFSLCWGHIIRNWVMEGDGCVLFLPKKSLSFMAVLKIFQRGSPSRIDRPQRPLIPKMVLLSAL